MNQPFRWTAELVAEDSAAVAPLAEGLRDIVEHHPEIQQVIVAPARLAVNVSMIVIASSWSEASRISINAVRDVVQTLGFTYAENDDDSDDPPAHRTVERHSTSLQYA